MKNETPPGKAGLAWMMISLAAIIATLAKIHSSRNAKLLLKRRMRGRQSVS